MSSVKVTNLLHASSANNNLVLGSGGTAQFYNTISVGNATPSTSGAGITFPSTDLHYSTNANTLDDYEEGDWTPTLIGGTTAGTTTYTTQAGSYIKIGRQVTVFFELRASAATGTGDLRIGGLPFTAANGNKYQSCGAIMTHGLNWSGGTSIVLYTETNVTYMNIYISGDDIAWVTQQMVNESQFFIGTFTYTAA